MSNRHRSQGIALPIVLLFSSMLLVTSAAWFDMALSRARAAGNSIDRVQAFHAADSALYRCAKAVEPAVSDPQSSSGALATEPVRWRQKSAFEGSSAEAIVPFATWPQSIRPPQCLIEIWPAQKHGDIGGYLITARGFGRSKGSEVWLQLQIDVTDGVVTKHWRRVVARPFQVPAS